MEVVENGFTTKIHNLTDIISYKKNIYQSIVNLKEELKEKEEQLKKAETYLKFNCQHIWITDYIDSMKNYKLGQVIKYCEICELSC